MRNGHLLMDPDNRTSGRRLGPCPPLGRLLWLLPGRQTEINQEPPIRPQEEMGLNFFLQRQVGVWEQTSRGRDFGFSSKHLLQYSAGVIFIWHLIAEMWGSQTRIKAVTVHPDSQKPAGEGWPSLWWQLCWTNVLALWGRIYFITFPLLY